jgi:hypothetical protein
MLKQYKQREFELHPIDLQQHLYIALTAVAAILSRFRNDYRWSMDWWIGFIDHLYPRLGTTSNYGATAELHNSQITIAPAKPFPACCSFTSRSLATASNSGDSSASELRSPCHNRPCRTLFNCHLKYSAMAPQLPLQSSAELVAPFLFFITPRLGPRRQHPVCSRCMRYRYCGNVFTEPLPRNGCDKTAHLTIVA